MVSTCKALLLFLSIVACVKADTAPPDVAPSTQQGATSIKPFIQSKLDAPPDESAGTCTAAAKGTLQDVGDVDTRCGVSWSKEKRHVVGHFHDKTPYSTITGHWDSCAHKTVHRNEIDIATHKIDTKVLVDHCGAVTITIDVPVDLNCKKQGQQWICQAHLPDVECKADTKSPPGTITSGNGNGDTGTTNIVNPGQPSAESSDTTSSNGTVASPISPPASKGKCKNKTAVGTTGPLPSVGAEQTPPPASSLQPPTEGDKTPGSQQSNGSNAAGDVKSGSKAGCNGKDCHSSNSSSSNSTDSSHSVYSSTGSRSGSGAGSGSGSGASNDGAQSGSSGSQPYHHTNSEVKPCDKAGNVIPGAADGGHSTANGGGDASSAIDGLYAGAPAVKVGGRRALMQRRSTPPSRSSLSSNKHSFGLH